MITKLKWLKAYFTRNILPADGATIGEVLYTSKNATGVRKQYVINLDTKVALVTTIDAAPADLLTKPGQVILHTVVAPHTESSLYIFNAQTPEVLPGLTKIVEGVFTQVIGNGDAITAINVLTGITVRAFDNTTAAGTTGNCVLSSLTASGLTLNTGTGAVTLNDNMTPGTYTLTYKVADKKEPTVFVTGTITVHVDVVS